MTATPTIEFTLTDARSALLPPERTGTARDRVRLMVANVATHQVEHTRFHRLSRFLQPGDAVVVNRSRTVAAALRTEAPGVGRLVVHLVSPTSEGLWLVELRAPNGTGTSPGPDLVPTTLPLAGGAAVQLLMRSPSSPRLWLAALEGIRDVHAHLEHHGKPIRYSDGQSGAIADYQTVFAAEPGSAEMPSAGRPFTPEIVTQLVARGVAVLPLVLHTGVSSYEDHETPGPERYDVPDATARVINGLRGAGGRIIAVGTTVVRALETVTDADGIVYPGRGVTELFVTPERGVRAVDGIISGWHEPRSSHLQMLEAVAGRPLLGRCYEAAVERGYVWHQFGDSLLVLR